MTTFKNNSTLDEGEIAVDITVEQDEGIFLAMAASRESDGRDLFDFVITDPSEIEYFFETVAEAKKTWEQYKAAEKP